MMGYQLSIIKQCIDIVSTPLAHIINLSISNGIVPDEMKIARVIPLYKSGDVNSLSIIDQFPFYQVFLNFLKGLFIIVYLIILINTKSFVIANMDLENSIRQL